ncbi:MAG: chromate transporter, partial [Bacteroidetes bacterium]|nr:chromate transporter [Bacteroidota bacterium]
LSTATFIGYVIEGIPGAVVATVGIFLPAFLFVGILNPLIPRLRSSAWMSAFLDAVNAAAVALMLAVSVDIGRHVLLSWETLLVSAAAAVAVFAFRVGSVWIILGGAMVGALLVFFV